MGRIRQPSCMTRSGEVVEYKSGGSVFFSAGYAEFIIESLYHLVENSYLILQELIKLNSSKRA